MDADKILTEEEERKQRELRRRERERRQRENPSKKPSRKIDIIDQLDATGIYGVGSRWH